jgi:hypothetical protein
VIYSLPMQTVDYVDVAARARELGCRVPTGIALLPGNFATAVNADELRYHEAAAEVRSAWRRIGLKDTGPHRRLLQNVGLNPVTFGQPVPLTVFFGLGLAGRPKAVLHALSAVAVILVVDPCSANAREARFDAIVERPNNDGYTCLEFHGQARELIGLTEPVQEIWAGGRNPSAENHEAT